MSSHTLVEDDYRALLIEELFDAAVDLEPDQQAVFLSKRCADDPELLSELWQLLRADQHSAHGLFDKPLPMPRDDDSRVGTLSNTVLGNYHNLQQIDEGGMGVVYRANHIALNKTVAIKVLRATFTHEPHIVSRFRNEANALARISHPGIVDVYDVGVHDSGRVYIVMEFLDGESLERRLQRVNALSVDMALSFALQTARALMAVHAKQIVHRDLKPANLFIVSDPEVPGGERIKLVDFGIAKLAHQGTFGTKSGTMLGTPSYMSPEQCRDSGQVDGRTDLYALGVILFRMLCGRLPFPLKKRGGFSIPQLERPAPAVSEFNTDVSAALVGLIARLLAIDPEHRFPSAAELIDALHAAEHMQPPLENRSGTREPVRNERARTDADPVAPTEHAIPTLVRPKQSPTVATSTLWSVPRLPTSLIQRPDIPGVITDVVLGGRARPIWLTSDHIEGATSGMGKSVIAAAVARDSEIRARFPDGVFWLTMGPTPNIPRLHARLARMAGFEHAAFEDPNDGTSSLRHHLWRRRVLLVLDDVRHAEHIAWFDIVGARGRILITSRHSGHLTAVNATRRRIDPLDREHARRLLLKWTDSTQNERLDIVDEVADICARVPLLLTLVGALANRPTYTWESLRDLLDTAIPSATHSRTHPQASTRLAAIEHRLIEHNARHLTDDSDLANAASRYAEMAVFADDERIPRAAMNIWWRHRGLDDDAIGRLVDAMIATGLAYADADGADRCVRLHDAHRRYMRSRFEDIAALHGAMCDALAAGCTDGLARGPDHDSERAYFYAKLPGHLILAGRARELDALLWSYDWLQGKLRACGPGELIDDFQRLPCHGDVVILRDALVCSHRALALDPDQLPTHLIGRLAYFAADEPRIRDLLHQAQTRADHAWLRPVTPSLSPPHGALVRTLVGHTAPVNGLALDPRGAYAVSGSQDGTVRLWDARTGQLLYTFDDHGDTVWAVSLSADGCLALSGSGDGCVTLWDTRERRLVRTFDDGFGDVQALALNADGTHAFLGSRNGAIQRWNTHSGQIVHAFQAHMGAIVGLALDSDGARMLSGSEDRSCKLWNARDGQLEHTLEGHAQPIRAIALSADGARALSGSKDRTVKLWNTRNGEFIRSFAGHTHSVDAVALSADGTHALSGASDGTIKLWNTRSGALERTLKTHSGWVRAVALSADGARILSASDDNAINVWRTRSAAHEYASMTHCSHHNAWIRTIALSADGTRALSGADDNDVKLWDTERGALLHVFGHHTDRIRAVAMNTDGTCALSGSNDCTAMLWSTDTGALIHTLRGHMRAVTAVALSADGICALTGSDDRRSVLWDTRGGQSIHAFVGHTSTITTVALSSDGALALTGSSDGTTKLWDTSAGKLIHTLSSDPPSTPSVPVTTVTFSTDNTYIIVGKRDSTITSWITTSGALHQSCRLFMQDVLSLQISKDGTRAVVGCSDRSMTLWNVTTQERLGRFIADAPIRTCALANREPMLIAAGDQSGRLHVLRRVLPTG